MEIGLLEGIMGIFPLSGETVPNRGGRVDSIKEHLSIILNTRRGSVAHLPDYGLPDSNEVSMKSRDSISQFGKDIEATVRKYEPRLKQISVRPLSSEPGSLSDFRLGFLLEARFRREDTRFHAFFKTSGFAEVKDAK